jgi:hypothetical protein
MSRALGGLIALMAVAACTGGPLAQTPSPSVRATCAAVSDLEVYPYADSSEFTGYGLARAQHVWFSAFGPVRGGKAVIDVFAVSAPTKVVIHADPDLKEAVELIGVECSTGGQLRFCYNQSDNCGLFSKSLAAEEMASKGFDHLSVSRASADYTGYMLFPRPGRYRLSVQSGSTEVGSTTIAVGQAG